MGLDSTDRIIFTICDLFTPAASIPHRCLVDQIFSVIDRRGSFQQFRWQWGERRCHGIQSENMDSGC